MASARWWCTPRQPQRLDLADRASAMHAMAARGIRRTSARDDVTNRCPAPGLRRPARRLVSGHREPAHRLLPMRRGCSLTGMDTPRCSSCHGPLASDSLFFSWLGGGIYATNRNDDSASSAAVHRTAPRYPTSDTVRQSRTSMVPRCSAWSSQVRMGGGRRAQDPYVTEAEGEALGKTGGPQERRGGAADARRRCRRGEAHGGRRWFAMDNKRLATFGLFDSRCGFAVPGGAAPQFDFLLRRDWPAGLDGGWRAGDWLHARFARRRRRICAGVGHSSAVPVGARCGATTASSSRNLQRPAPPLRMIIHRRGHAGHRVQALK